MKKMLLAGVMSSFILTNAYAINPPATDTDKKKPYGGAAFVSQPEEIKSTSDEPVRKKSNNDAVDPLSTLSPNQNTMLADRKIQVTTTKIVKTAAGCPVTCPQKT